MKKIVIVYHSGVGVAKKVADKIATQLARHYCTEIFSIEKLPKDFNFNDCDGLAIGFSVILTHPTTRMLNFIDSIKSLSESKPVYFSTTCGWYSANTLRIFAKQCIKKNIIPVVHRVFWGCPATDGTLLAPFIKRFFVFSNSWTEILCMM